MNPPAKNTSPFAFYLLSGWYPVLWISLAVLLVYAKTTGFDFLNYDEYHLITGNKAFLTDPASIVRVFFRSVGSSFSHFYRPVLMLSFIADARLHGFIPFWYHTTNILLHLAASLLLYVLLRRLKCGDIRSFVCTLLFAVHPMLVQAVAWVPGRNDSLLGIFVFGSCLALIDYAERRRLLSYFLHLAGLFFALLTKETAISVFPVFAFYLFRVNRDVPPAERGKVLGGWALAAAAFVFLYAYSIRYDQSFYGKVFTYVPSLPAGLLNYLGKMLFPFDLSVFPFAADLSIAAGVPAVCAIVLAVFLARNRRWDAIWFGGVWVLFFFLPPLILGWQGVYFDHRAYVPMAGLFIMFGGLRGEVFDRLTVAYRGPLVAAVAAVLVVFSLLSARRSEVFTGDELFWESAVASSPHSFLACKNLGAAYGHLGKYDQALASFRKAIALNDEDVGTRFFAAQTLVLLGRKQEAKQEYANILLLEPHNADAKQAVRRLESEEKNGGHAPEKRASAR